MSGPLLHHHALIKGKGAGLVYQDVAFINLINMSAAGNILTKTGGANFVCSGDTNTEITSGDVWLKATVDNVGGQTNYSGFTDVYNSTTTIIPFMWFLRTHIDEARILENAVIKKTIAGPININDTYEIKYEAGVVNFYKNGGLEYTSVNAPVYPVRGTVGIRTTGDTTYPLQIAV